MGAQSRWTRPMGTPLLSLTLFIVLFTQGCRASPAKRKGRSGRPGGSLLIALAICNATSYGTSRWSA